jgi:hypothetical protein
MHTNTATVRASRLTSFIWKGQLRFTMAHEIPHTDTGDDLVVAIRTDSEGGASAEQRRESEPTSPAVLADRIAQRAYEIYRERGGEHGRDTDDWFRAEAELTNTPS